MKYQSLAMWFEDLDYHKVAEYFKNELGLVTPNQIEFSTDKGPFPHKLVWEDESGVGRYRVDYLEERGGLIFRYWVSGRMTQKILERDPMLDAIKKVYNKFKPKKCTIGEAVILAEIDGCP
jgi:hypothetical protein